MPYRVRPPAGRLSRPGAAGDDTPPKISIASLLGPVTLSGFGDFYYGYDNNHPFNNLAGLRFLRGAHQRIQLQFG